MRRSFSALLTALVAWFCIGAGERSVAAGFGLRDGAVDVDHPALHQLGRSEPELGRQDLARAGRGPGGGWALAAALGLEPPRTSIGSLGRTPARQSRRTQPCWPERSSRGPPA